jgi:hypothetical protein
MRTKVAKFKTQTKYGFLLKQKISPFGSVGSNITLQYCGILLLLQEIST